MLLLNQGIGMAAGGIKRGSKGASQLLARWAHVEGLGKFVHRHESPRLPPCPELLQVNSIVIVCLAYILRVVNPEETGHAQIVMC